MSSKDDPTEALTYFTRWPSLESAPTNKQLKQTFKTFFWVPWLLRIFFRSPGSVWKPSIRFDFYQLSDSNPERQGRKRKRNLCARLSQLINLFRITDWLWLSRPPEVAASIGVPVDIYLSFESRLEKFEAQKQETMKQIWDQKFRDHWCSNNKL